MKKVLKVRRTFNSIADKYIIANHLLSFGQDICWRKKMWEEIKKNIKDTDLVLDIACGTGENFKYMPIKFRKKVGLDPARHMLKIARKSFPDVTFIEGVAEELPFKDSSVDLIVISFGIRNFENRQKALKEFNRVLKKDGLLAILEFFPLENGSLINKVAAFYIYKILPYFGGLITGNYKAYKYLSESIKNFVPPEVLKLEFKKNSITPIKNQKIFPDVHILLGRKD
jgi:demethylmenaquinone methyltransferase/2-methoxy-6-polyprenyl-1,4-benzoquinol methylase